MSEKAHGRCFREILGEISGAMSEGNSRGIPEEIIKVFFLNNPCICWEFIQEFVEKFLKESAENFLKNFCYGIHAAISWAIYESLSEEDIGEISGATSWQVSEGFYNVVFICRFFKNSLEDLVK